MNYVIPIRVSARVVIRKREDDAALDATTAGWIDGAAADLGLGTATALEIAGAEVRGGRVKLSHDPATGDFRAVAEYESPMSFANVDLEFLKKRTHGDWHDGVGGSFFEYLGQSLGIAVSVWVAGEMEVDQRPADAPRLGPWSELVKACWQRKPVRVRELLDAGADADARADGLPALHAAIINGQVEVALLLIERGADVRACDLLEPRRGALRTCATCVRLPDDGAARIARALLDRGADPNCGGDSPLAIARRRGRERLASVLATAAGT